MYGLGQREGQGKLGEMSWERKGKRPQNRRLTAFLLVHPQLCFLSFCWVGTAIVHVKAWHVGLCPAAQKDVLPPADLKQARSIYNIFCTFLDLHRISHTSREDAGRGGEDAGRGGEGRGGEGRMRANAAATSRSGAKCVFNYWQLPTDVQTHLDQSCNLTAFFSRGANVSFIFGIFFLPVPRRKWAAEARNTHAPRHRRSTACRADSLRPEPDRPVLDAEAPPRPLVSFQTGGAPRRHFPPLPTVKLLIDAPGRRPKCQIQEPKRVPAEAVLLSVWPLQTHLPLFKMNPTSIVSIRK